MAIAQAIRAVAAATEVEVPEQPGRAAAVHRARLAYVTDPDRQSLQHHWRKHAGAAIGWSSFRRRSSLGDWPGERERFWKLVTEKVVTERAGAMANVHVRELGELAQVRERLLDLVGTTQPKSLEGTISALVRLDESIDRKRQALVDRFEPLLQTVRQQAPSAGSFTPEETRCMAHALLRLRATTVRAGS